MRAGEVLWKNRSFADHWEKTQVGELTYSIGSA